jgi:cell wall assembly regulator SMI1
MLDSEFPSSPLGLAARSVPQPTRPIFAPPASAEDIALLEAAVGNSLPTSIRAFLAEHDSIVAMDVWNGYWIGGVCTLLRSIERGDFPGRIDSHRVMPIATDGGGNAFLTPVDSDGPVWKWSHETGAIKEIASSFQHFLDRIADDFRMFAAGKGDWPYMSG